MTVLAGLLGTVAQQLLEPAAGGGGGSYLPPAEPNYNNPGGLGNRMADITVTVNMSHTSDPNHSVDGNFGTNSTYAWYFSSNQGNGSWVKWQFNERKVIDQMTWYQNNATTHGTWRVQGSNNDSVWTDLSSDFTLGGTAQVIDFDLYPDLFTGFEYYRILKVGGGGTSNSPWLTEVRFRIDSEPTPVGDLDPGFPRPAQQPRAPRWRLKGTVAGIFSGGALAEIDFRGEGDVTLIDIATGTPSAGSEAFGGFAAAAFDGLPEGNMWAGANGAVAAGTSWVAWQFPAWVSLYSFAITARTGGESNQMWDEFDLEYSFDGVTWYLQQSYVDTSNWSSAETKVFTVDPDLAQVDVKYQGRRNDTGGAGETFTFPFTDDPAGGIVLAMRSLGNSGTFGTMSIDGAEAVPLGTLKRGSFDSIGVFAVRGLSGTGDKSVTWTETGTDYRDGWTFYVVQGAGDVLADFVGTVQFNDAGDPEGNSVISVGRGGAVVAFAMVRDVNRNPSAITDLLKEDSAWIENDTGFYFWGGSEDGFQQPADRNLQITTDDGSNNTRTLVAWIVFEPGLTATEVQMDVGGMYAITGLKEKVRLETAGAYATIGPRRNQFGLDAGGAYVIVEE